MNESSNSWQAELMQYDTLHNYSCGKMQKIALIDSGVAKFQSKQVEKLKTLTSDGVYDDNGHGTMMCSLILGYKKQVVGIAPQAKVFSYKVVKEDGKVKCQLMSSAINEAVKDNVTVINISLGSYLENAAVKRSLRIALSKGITVIASAGDYESGDMLFPAKMKDVISVGAIDKNSKVWSGTNDSKDCDILAPGVDVKVINNNGEVFYSTGTSQATAIVCGYVALLKDYALTQNVKLSNMDIEKVLRKISKHSLTYLQGLEYIKNAKN